MNVDLTRFDFRALRFLKSETVELMSAEEVGQFVLLMCHAWLAGKDASLPDNPVLLARYARCERVSDAVMLEWKEGPDGRLYNETLSEEWAAAVGRSAHGQKAASARWNSKHSPSNAHPSDGAVANPIQTKPIQTKPSQERQGQTPSSEPGGSDPQIAPVITLPLHNGLEHAITDQQVAEWTELYPAVDVPQALRSMRGWLLEHRANRKTKAGVGKFIVGWLSREQDKARPAAAHAKGGPHGNYPARKSNAEVTLEGFRQLQQAGLDR
jgi:uncharacterized protein YdaU (DUF1376 family)